MVVFVDDGNKEHEGEKKPITGVQRLLQYTVSSDLCWSHRWPTQDQLSSSTFRLRSAQLLVLPLKQMYWCHYWLVGPTVSVNVSTIVKRRANAGFWLKRNTDVHVLIWTAGEPIWEDRWQRRSQTWRERSTYEEARKEYWQILWITFCINLRV